MRAVPIKNQWPKKYGDNGLTKTQLLGIVLEEEGDLL